MIVMCPGCSGIDLDVIKREFKDEKIVCGCIGECGGRMDETIVARGREIPSNRNWRATTRSRQDVGMEREGAEDC